MRLHAILLPVAILILAACGSDGGAGSGPLPASPVAVADPMAPVTPGDLGSRAVPGYSIQVRQLGPAVAGQPLTIAASIIPEAGLGLPALVEAAVSADEPGVWTAGVQAADGSWTWTATLPADLTGQRAWLRLTDADGNVAETGFTDFPLAK